MKDAIDVFLVWTDTPDMRATLGGLVRCGAVARVFLLAEKAVPVLGLPERVSFLSVDAPSSSRFVRAVARRAEAPYVALFLRPVVFRPGYRCMERMLAVARDTQALMVYADHYAIRPDGPDGGETVSLSPKIDYQEGSVRDDFDFGGLWLVRTEALRGFASHECAARYRFAALYALRLYLSREGRIFHLDEPLYAEAETDLRKSGEKQFDYVNPANREVQLENERACTDHLKRIGAWLAPDEYDDLPIDTDEYPVEASVVIPVRDRVRTIGDAVRSALAQEAAFPFNVIVVDNHSTDGDRKSVV